MRLGLMVRQALRRRWERGDKQGRHTSSLSLRNFKRSDGFLDLFVVGGLGRE